MAPKTAADFLKKAKQLHTGTKEDEQKEDESFVPGRDNNDADDFDRRELNRARTRSRP